MLTMRVKLIKQKDKRSDGENNAQLTFSGKADPQEALYLHKTSSWQTCLEPGLHCRGKGNTYIIVQHIAKNIIFLMSIVLSCFPVNVNVSKTASWIYWKLFVHKNSTFCIRDEFDQHLIRVLRQILFCKVMHFGSCFSRRPPAHVLPNAWPVLWCGIKVFP